MKQALFGNGGHSREVRIQIDSKLPCFVDDIYSTEGTRPLSQFNPEEYSLMIAVADSIERKKIVERLPTNTKYFSWVHPTALIMDENIIIPEGSFIGAYSILTSNITLGKHTILNRSNHIGHDCQIGDFFSAMPGSIISGNVKIGNSVYLGTNSSIREKITITNSVKIGMNSSVVKNIEDPGVYVGTPSKKIKDIE
jgi:sugar O-acyltransferase (sialic acid O-acetyltransferase NeuD family)